MMDDKRPNSLDYATRERDRTHPHPASLVIGILLLIIGGSVVLFGVFILYTAAVGDGPVDGGIVYPLVGASLCWLGMKLKSNRPAG